MKVLVTGNKGYIGSVLAWGLIDRSYEVGGYAKGGKYVGEWKDGKLWEGTSYAKNGAVTNTISEGVKKPAN